MQGTRHKALVECGKGIEENSKGGGGNPVNLVRINLLEAIKGDMTV